MAMHEIELIEEIPDSPHRVRLFVSAKLHRELEEVHKYAGGFQRFDIDFYDDKATGKTDKKALSEFLKAVIYH